jgi:hypothetical protein
MRRTILLTGVLPFISAFLGGIMALHVGAPGALNAEETRIRAESVVVVDESGTNRVSMSSSTTGTDRSAVDVYSAAGINRAVLSTAASSPGDITQPLDAVNLVLFAPEGRLASGAEGIARLGTGAGGAGATFHLADRQGQIRIWLQVDADGNPSIEMRDASGNVTWSAQ